MPSHVSGSSTEGRTLEYSLSRYTQHVCMLVDISHFNAGGLVFCVMEGTNLYSLEVTEMIDKDLAKLFTNSPMIEVL